MKKFTKAQWNRASGMKQSYRNLINAALWVRPQAYAPYSNYLVGSAIFGPDWQIFTGVNVENAAYTGSHAEYGAISSMVTSTRNGQKLIYGLAVATENGGTPCGNCLQHIAEFTQKGSHDILIFLVNAEHEVTQYYLSELFPVVFHL